MKDRRIDVKLKLENGEEVLIEDTPADPGFIVMRYNAFGKKVNKVEVEQKVPKIECGTVIDHIIAGYGDKVYQELKQKIPEETTLCLLENVPSKKIGTKDLIKLWNYELPKEAIERIYSLFENKPKPTINYIEDWIVKYKIRPID